MRGKSTTAERVWLQLVLLTLGGAVLAESGSGGGGIAVAVAVLIAIKGRWVIDHYMDMARANRALRRVLHGFVTLVPLMVLASAAFSPQIARLTASLLP